MTYSTELRNKIAAYHDDCMDAINNPGETAWLYASGSIVYGTDSKVEGMYTDGGLFVPVSDMHPFLIEMAQDEADHAAGDVHEMDIYFDDALIAS